METPIKPVVSMGAKRMLSSVLTSSLAHNKRNLAHGAKNKNPQKLTVAEKEALEYVKIKEMKREYRSIHKKYENGDGYGDVYFCISSFLDNYENIIKSKRDRLHILDRMQSDDSTEEIVDDFLFSLIYYDLRQELE
jgi:hypothetical protein